MGNSRTGEAVAPTGNSHRVAEAVELTPESGAWTLEELISGVLIFDATTNEPGGSGVIDQIDLLEHLTAAGTLLKPNMDLFLYRAKFSADPAKGTAFTMANLGEDWTGNAKSKIIDRISFTNWPAVNIDSENAQVSQKGLGLNFESMGGDSDESRQIFGRLISRSTGSPDVNAQYKVRLHINKD